MAATGESSVSELLKINEKCESETTKCRQCKRIVREKLQCKKCKFIFHPSCLILANKSKNNVCMHEVDEKQEIVEKLMSEIELLRKIISEQEEKYELMAENKKLLEENNRLLRENNDFLHDKLKEKPRSFSDAVRKDTAKNEPIKRGEKKVHKQREVNESENQLIPTTQAPAEGSGDENTDKIEDKPHEQKKNTNIRPKKPILYGTSEGTVKGIPRRKWFFVSRLDPSITESDVKAIMEKKCPNSNIIVEKQKLRSDYQSAFKVGVPIELEDRAAMSDFWPKDTRVNKFNFFLARKKLQQMI